MVVWVEAFTKNFSLIRGLGMTSLWEKELDLLLREGLEEVGREGVTRAEEVSTVVEEVEEGIDGVQ